MRKNALTTLLLIAITILSAPHIQTTETQGTYEAPINPYYVVAVSRWGGDAGWVIPGKCFSPGHHFLLRPDIDPEEIPVNTPVNGTIISIQPFLLGGYNISIETRIGQCKIRVDLTGITPQPDISIGADVTVGQKIGHVSKETVYPGFYVARDCGAGWGWVPGFLVLPGSGTPYKTLAGKNWNPLVGPYERSGGACGGPGYLLKPSTANTWMFFRQNNDTLLIPIGENLYVQIRPAPYATVDNVSRVNWSMLSKLQWFQIIVAGSLESYLPSNYMAQLHTFPWTHVVGATWAPGTIYRPENWNTQEAQWVYKHRYNVSLNPEGPFPQCKNTTLCMDFYLDYENPEALHAKAEFAVNNLTRTGYKGILLDQYDLSWSSLPGASEILERFNSKHDIPIQQSYPALYQTIRGMLDNDTLLLTRSSINGKQITHDPRYHIYLVDNEFCLQDTRALIDSLNTIRQNASYIEIYNCTIRQALRLYIAGKITGIEVYAGLQLPINKLYIYSLDDPLTTIVTKDNVYIRIYHNGIAALGKPNSEVTIMLPPTLRNKTFYDPLTNTTIYADTNLTITLDENGIAYLVRAYNYTIIPQQPENATASSNHTSSQGTTPQQETKDGKSGHVAEIIILVITIILSYLTYRSKKR